MCAHTRCPVSQMEKKPTSKSFGIKFKAEKTMNSVPNETGLWTLFCWFEAALYPSK